MGQRLTVVVCPSTLSLLLVRSSAGLQPGGTEASTGREKGKCRMSRAFLWLPCRKQRAEHKVTGDKLVAQLLCHILHSSRCGTIIPLPVSASTANPISNISDHLKHKTAKNCLFIYIMPVSSS